MWIKLSKIDFLAKFLYDFFINRDMAVKNNNNNNKHPHPVLKRELTFGQKASDKLTGFAGSWSFIFTLLVLMAVWMLINLYAAITKIWDPYPFILLNFVLSTLAAIQAPIILMSQNRSTERDRINFKYDYQVNRKAEREIANMQKDLEEIKKLIKKS